MFCSRHALEHRADRIFPVHRVVTSRAFFRFFYCRRDYTMRALSLQSQIQCVSKPAGTEKERRSSSPVAPVSVPRAVQAQIHRQTARRSSQRLVRYHSRYFNLPSSKLYHGISGLILINPINRTDHEAAHPCKLRQRPGYRRT